MERLAASPGVTSLSKAQVSRMPKSFQPWVSALVRTIFEQPDDAPGPRPARPGRAGLEAELPAAAEHLDEPRETQTGRHGTLRNHTTDRCGSPA